MKYNYIRMTLKKVGCIILAATMIVAFESVNVYAETDSEVSVRMEQLTEKVSDDDQAIVTDQEAVDVQETENETETVIQVTPADLEAVNTQIDNDVQNINDEDVSDTSDIIGDGTVVKGSAVAEAVEKKNGVIEEDGVYRYYIDDVMQKWLITDVNGDRYYADSNGVLACDKIIKFNNKSIGWVYFGSDGKAKKWLFTTPDGDRYYAGSDGALVRNRFIKFNDASIGWLYFGDDGKAVKWLFTTPDGNRYYAGSDGMLARNKVIKFKDKSIGWLYFGDDGKAAKWLITTPDGDRYYADSDGALVRNKMIKFSNESLGWLYFGNDGKVQKAKIIVDNGKYYYATSVDGRIMRTKGLIILDGKEYYAGEGGVLLRNVWKKIGNRWYHFTSTGANENPIKIPEGLGITYTLTYYSVNGFVFVPSMRTSIAKGSNQERVWRAWKISGAKYNDGLAMIDNAYLVAVTNTFGKVGDLLKITYRNGNTMYAVIADEKSQQYVAWDHNPANKYGHNNGKNVVEFEVDPTYYVKYNHPGTPALWNNDLRDSGGVAQIENLGHKY